MAEHRSILLMSAIFIVFCVPLEVMAEAFSYVAPEVASVACQSPPTVQMSASRRQAIKSSLISPNGPSTSPLNFASKGASNSTSVVTQHDNNYRTGVQSRETILTPSAVKLLGMKLSYSPIGVDGYVDAQPLYLHQYLYDDGSKDSIITITANNTIYNFNAADGTLIWKLHLTDRNSTLRGDPQDIPPTPVIDAVHGVMYAIFGTTNKITNFIPTDSNHMMEFLSSIRSAYWLISVDVRTGKELNRIKIHAQLRRSDGSILTFDPRIQQSHPALLLDNGNLFVAFGSNPNWESFTDFHGWVLRYDASTLSAKGVFSTTKELVSKVGEGGGVWQGGGGLASDSLGNVYFLSGNAPADATHHSYGDGFIRLTPEGDGLRLTGFFPPPGAPQMDALDLDLGSGGLVVVPGTALLLGGGKTGMLYAVDGSQLEEDGSVGLSDSIQAFSNTYHPDWNYGCPTPSPTGCASWEAGPHLHGSPIYWQGRIYDAAEKDHMKSIPFDVVGQKFVTNSQAERILTGAIRATPTMMPGGLSSLSANGDDIESGVIWSTLPSAGQSILVAYKANTLDLLWESLLPADAPKMSHRGSPTIADGRLIVATNSYALLVYQLGDLAIPGGGVVAFQPIEPPKTAMVMAGEGQAMGDDGAAPPGEGTENIEIVPNPARVEAPDGQQEIFRVRANAQAGAERFEDGSKIGNMVKADDGSGVELKLVTSSPGPDPDAPPWELYRVVARRGHGILSSVEWVQRIDTHDAASTYIFLGKKP